MPSMKHLACAAALALSLPLAAHAETVTLQAASATPSADPHTGARVVDVALKPESQKALADFTRNRVGKRIQLRSNGVLLTSATLQSPLEGDSFRITAGEHGFAGKSAEDIAQGIMKDGGLTVDDENTAK
ncbi:SecDF P1 head subdomain-containing protein [Achromobacter kerstersii]|uniref:SecDF P1 head subdomain-containing protein n=1 Tax=Achromobacter kerstersii TaxID=1353890 RepID=UPI00320BAEFF